MGAGTKPSLGKRIVKRLGVVFGVLVLLIAVVGITAYFYLGSDRGRAYVKDKIIEAAKGSLRGDLSIDALTENPLSGLSLDGVNLKSPAGNKVLTAENIEVDYDLLDVLGDTTTVKQITLNQATIYLRRDADGKLEVSSIPVEKDSTGTLIIKSLVLRDCTLVIIDKQLLDESQRIAGINGEMRIESQPQKTSVTINTLQGVWREQNRNLRIAGQAQFGQYGIEANNVTIALGESSVDIPSLTVPSSKHKALAARAIAQVDKHSLRALGAHNATAPLELDVQVSGTVDRPQVVLQGSIGKAQLELNGKGNLDAEQATIELSLSSFRPRMLSATLPSATTTLNLRLDASQLDKGLEAKLNIDAKGTLEQRKTGRVRFEVNANGAERAGRIALSISGDKLGNLKANVEGSWRKKPMFAPSTLDAQINLDAATALVASQTNVSGVISMDADFRGSPDSLQASGTLTSKRTRYGSVTARALRGDFAIDWNNQTIGGSAGLKVARLTDGSDKWNNVSVNATGINRKFDRINVSFRVGSGPKVSSLAGEARVSLVGENIVAGNVRITAKALEHPWTLTANRISFVPSREVQVDEAKLFSPVIAFNASAALVFKRRWRARELMIQLEVPSLERLPELERNLRYESDGTSTKASLPGNLAGAVHGVLKLERGQFRTSLVTTGLRYRSINLRRSEFIVDANQKREVVLRAEVEGRDIGFIDLHAQGWLPGPVGDFRSYRRFAPEALLSFTLGWKGTKLAAVREFFPEATSLRGNMRGNLSFARDPQTKTVDRVSVDIHLGKLSTKEEASNLPQMIGQRSGATAQSRTNARNKGSVFPHDVGYQISLRVESDTKATRLDLSADVDNVRLLDANITSQLNGPQAEKAMLDGRLPNSEISGEIVVPSVPVSLITKAFPMGIELTGKLNGKVKIGGRLLQPQFNGGLRSTGLNLRGATLPNVHIGSNMGPSVEDRGWVRLSQENGGQLSFVAYDFLSKQDGHFIANAKDFDLAFLNELFLTLRIPVAAVNGTVVGEAGGALWRAEEKTRGSLRLSDGRIGLPQPVGTLENVAMQLKVSPTLYDLDLSGASGEGAAKLSLRISAMNWWPRAIDATLDLKEVPLSTSGLRAQVDGEMKLDAQFTKQAWVGKTEIVTLGIKLPTLPQGGRDLHPIGRLEDIVYAHDKSQEAVMSRLVPAANIDIVSSEDAITLSSDLLEVRAGVNMKLGKKPADEQITLSGNIEASGGYVTLLDRRYKISRALVDFDRGQNGQPYIDVLIEREFQDARIGVTVSGVVPNIEVGLRSNPPVYNEGQMISLIVSGRVGSDKSSGIGTVLGAVAGLAGREFLEYINSPISVDTVSVNTTGEGNVSSLAVGKWLTEDLFLSYHLNFNPDRTENEDEARLEWWLSPKWLLEVTAGDAGAASSDLLWIHRF